MMFASGFGCDQKLVRWEKIDYDISDPRFRNVCTLCNLRKRRQEATPRRLQEVA